MATHADSLFPDFQHNFEPLFPEVNESETFDEGALSSPSDFLSSGESPPLEMYSSPSSLDSIIETSPRGSAIEVELLHKPRGSKGVWLRVEDGDKLRVTKGKGKRLKLEIKLGQNNYNRSSIQIELFDIDGSNHVLCNNGFTIETSQTYETLIEIEIKLLKVCKRLQFYVQLNTAEGDPVCGKSIEFGTHNSGTLGFNSMNMFSNGSMLQQQLPPAQQQPPALQHKLESDKKRKKTELLPSYDSTSQNNSPHFYSGSPHSGTSSPTSSPPYNSTTTPFPPNTNHYIQQAQHSQHSQPLQQYPMQLPPSSDPMKISNYNNNSANNKPRYVDPSSSSSSSSTVTPVNNNYSNNKPIIPPLNFPNNNNYNQPQQQQSQPTGFNSPYSNNNGNYANISLNNATATNKVGMNNANNTPSSLPPDDSSNVTTVPGSLDVNGMVRARAFMQFSDIRLKTNICDLVDAVQIVTALQGKTYEWKRDAFNNGGEVQGDDEKLEGGKRVVGLIAQEVQRVLPEVVHEDPATGLLQVSYAEILPVLIEAFKQFMSDYKDDKQEIQAQLDDLSSKINKYSLDMKSKKAQQEGEVQQVISQLNRASTMFKLQYLQQLKVLPAQQQMNFSHSIEKGATSASPSASSPAVAVTASSPALTPKQVEQVMVNTAPNNRDRPPRSLCSARRIGFVVLFLVSLLATIAGILLIVKNLPQSAPQAGASIQSVQALWRAESTQGITAQGKEVRVEFIVGILLVGFGTVGMIAAGVGSCCRSNICR